MRPPNGSAAEAARIIAAIVCAVIPLIGVIDSNLMVRGEVVIDLDIDLFAIHKRVAAGIRGTCDDRNY